ncbi:MAG TPA: transglycosylase family protein [Candidatus Saccharimonadales bacterium]|nr:transglycosylase family protein [Candidatus Saccharimonadales bacterium]
MFSVFFAQAEAVGNPEQHRESTHKLGSLAVAGPPGKKSGKNKRKPDHHLTPEEWAARQVSPEEFREWKKVNICEEGGDWHVSGPVYSGGLGISNVNWVAYGGRRFAPTGATATPAEQIVIAQRIQPNPPDQHGCDPGGW